MAYYWTLIDKTPFFFQEFNIIRDLVLIAVSILLYLTNFIIYPNTKKLSKLAKDTYKNNSNFTNTMVL